jgi:nitrogen regulatory protein PII
METVKRLEIIIDSMHTQRVVEVLRENGATGYTIIRNASGAGDRGERRDDELTGVFSNTYILSACAPELAQTVVEAVRPLLKRYGGVCLVSDAQWLKH